MVKSIQTVISKKIIFPIILLILVIFLYIMYKIKIYPLISVKLHQDIKKIFITLLIICICFILHKVGEAITKWYQKEIASKTATTFDDKVILLIKKSYMVIIWTLGLLMILPLYGVNTAALITALGVSSLAIALAAQDTIANIISGFLIIIDSPFRIGDKIKLPTGENVTVREIGVRRSQFVAEDSSIIIVPNVDLCKSKIVNYTYGEKQKSRSSR